MWPKIVVGVVAMKIMCSIVNATSSSSSSNIPSLPYCPSTSGTGSILVSTLDGKLSALNSSGQLSWEIETGPGPLLISNIHKLELTNNGEWIRIIPSLSGTLYKFDGSTIDPISLSAETLLKSSFKYSDDLVMAGGIEVRTYGVGFRTGRLIYECSQAKCTNHEKEDMDDIMVIERSTQTIRAVEPRTGLERWNFSVGLHNIKLPQVSCIDTKLFETNLSAVVPEGLLLATTVKNNREEYWQYKFHSPIVRVWKWDGMKLNEINLFDVKHMPNLITESDMLPSIYVGMHKKQLYIHESLYMRNLLQRTINTDLVPAESKSVTKIPWKPVSASAEITEDDSTALSVLNNSEYVNGNGYYLYSESALEAKNSALCESNNSKVIEEVIEQGKETEEFVSDSASGSTFFQSMAKYYREIAVMIITAIAGPFLVRFWHKNIEKPQEIIIVEKPVQAEITGRERSRSERNSESFVSRFSDDFDLIQCLGRGGFGIVFQVKSKYDDCQYAIKRITLPNEQKSRDRVMREVKALAKFDHKNIIRYFSCWVEHPPLGWELHNAKELLEASFSEIGTSANTFTRQKRTKSYSTSVDVSHFRVRSSSDHDETTDDSSIIVFKHHHQSEESDDNDDSVIFQNSASQLDQTDEDDSVVFQYTNSKMSKSAICSITKQSKEINWKRPGRKHHSWDLTESNLISLGPKDPPVYLYIQMQLCQKDSLKERLSLTKERNYNEMLSIFLQILDAVEYVHLRKLIHRDLKPSNIFFSLEGQIKVGDFGLVKDIESTLDLESNRRGNVGSVRGHTKEVGTTLYMSPEQATGRNYDYKVDIYSLGIILFELLVPFSTDMERIKTLTELKHQTFPDGFSNQYPSEFALLQNMLHEDPAKRLTTIGIRARNPFSKSDPCTTDDQHFCLTKFHS